VPDTLGRVLRHVRSGERRSRLADLRSPDTMQLTSPAFPDGGTLPTIHAGRGVGRNISPALQWTGAPAETRQLVLILEDVDVPLPRPLLHTVALIDPTVDQLAEGALQPGTAELRFVRTTLGCGYSGPRPIPGHGVHRYRFHMFALDAAIPDATPNVSGVLAHVRRHLLARGSLTGTYQR
jgi:phosphatidylethanolamine-binding protein (PEBP) family uncharacterized protein